METLLESIRAAIAADASEQTRATGAQACRTILTALEAKPGEPMPAPSSVSSTQIAQMLGALKGVPAEQLLDLAITRLRAALPTGTETPRVAPVKFHVVQLPRKKP